MKKKIALSDTIVIPEYFKGVIIKDSLMESALLNADIEIFTIDAHQYSHVEKFISSLVIPFNPLGVLQPARVLAMTVTDVNPQPIKLIQFSAGALPTIIDFYPYRGYYIDESGKITLEPIWTIYNNLWTYSWNVWHKDYPNTNQLNVGLGRTIEQVDSVSCNIISPRLMEREIEVEFVDKLRANDFKLWGES